ncbi:polysaccharide deacetylase family protein [Aquabacterium sp. CECT 9606]|uniref:polysaccharide deacetylase family protein n=1 Tax=Aquabacterium sp. CECT 9606 TaxID=2845822 RepID=UPI001E2B1B87|nr:polysaccharide deacetylase family protein [Aquabacterium sp. CECT 9606]CAH0351755.1 Poly-beta-1,6-N-acetyl-D-glucosamine N-deacetylase [Aquabacterium sp. CECT 9606]
MKGFISRRHAALSIASAGLTPMVHAWSPQADSAVKRLPILTYHRFSNTATDSMTVRTSLFRAHLRLIERLKCNVIPLQDWVDFRCGKGTAIPERSVILTADDGHRSQFEVMAPILASHGWKMTLFIYPSAISNARYAMTWAQVHEMTRSRQYALGSHTYWHPNLIREQGHMSLANYRQFVTKQLTWSKDELQQRCGQPVSLLAWPFGLCDGDLMGQAAECGYQAAYALGNRPTTANDALYAEPRYLMVDSFSEQRLEALLTSILNG